MNHDAPAYINAVQRNDYAASTQYMHDTLELATHAIETYALLHRKTFGRPLPAAGQVLSAALVVLQDDLADQLQMAGSTRS